MLYKSGDKTIEAQQMSQIPQYSLFPVDNQRVFLGATVLDMCAKYGMVDDNDRCICATEYAIFYFPAYIIYIIYISYTCLPGK